MPQSQHLRSQYLAIHPCKNVKIMEKTLKRRGVLLCIGYIPVPDNNIFSGMISEEFQHNFLDTLDFALAIVFV